MIKEVNNQAVIKVMVEDVKGVLVTTSNRVAEELEVRHKDLLEKIDGYIKRFGSAESSAQFYIPSEYKTLDGRKVRNYLITEKGVAQLVGGYSSAVSKAFDLNVAYINEFERMKNELSTSKIPTSFKDALYLAYQQQVEIERLELENKNKEKTIQIQAPKVSYYDTVLQSDSLMTVTDIAKDYGMSATKFNKLLNDLGVQYKKSKKWYLYAEYTKEGYTQSKTIIIENKEEETTFTKVYTCWTQKGRLFLYNLLKDNGYVPVVEMENSNMIA